jgi:hypothetical protein
MAMWKPQQAHLVQVKVEVDLEIWMQLERLR